MRLVSNPEPEAGGYKKDTIVELQAIPADNWKFAHWTGDIDGNSQVITVKMDSPKNIKAVFSKDTHFIYVIVQGNGKVEETVLAGRGVYEYGSVVELKAVPDDGWLFSHWELDATGTTNPLVVYVDKSRQYELCLKSPR
ncbi:MAG TPA: hypothetical protein PLN81_06345 [Bacillota bacterium]|nr:hypothetical protein [Bacillota bacterium]HPT61203.1 hypothetical protein [Bacillota bacterium]HPZ73221.1 hypothetical protein [Bacillota bacterium]HQD78802.1 hypothetical protein [Bacillota bacterium]